VRDGTGYARAAQELILSLDAVGFNVSCRPVKLNNLLGEVHPRIAELENHILQGVDACIQHSLPLFFSYNARAGKNIGYFFYESSKIPEEWVAKINLLDALIVPCNDMLHACIRGGVYIPIHVVPCATDVSKYERSYKPLAQIEAATAGNFVFYSIFELSKRKGLVNLLRAFHSEFDPAESVSLVIKVSKPGVNQVDLHKEIESVSQQVKAGLKLFNGKDFHKREIEITDRMSEEGVARLHNSCHCYVSGAYGEAWGYPAMDAMGFGRAVIAPGIGGFKEFLTEECGWFVDTYPDDIFGAVENFPNLYTANEQWDSPSIEGLRRAMREVYENKVLYKEKSQACLERIYYFSHEKVGERLKTALRE
jgi:glycosyltransferase involved in cell wall biosynthesis